MTLETSACKELEFAADKIYNECYYVYSAVSAKLGETYTAFVEVDSYTALTNPQLSISWTWILTWNYHWMPSC